MSDTQDCARCKYFRRNPQSIGTGFCLYAAPVAVPVMQAGVPSVVAARPPVSADDTCGQWSPMASEAANG